MQTFTKSNLVLINYFFFATIQLTHLSGLPSKKNFSLQTNFNRKMGISRAKSRVLCLLPLLFITMDPSTKRNGADNRILERQSDAGESPKGMSMWGGATYVTQWRSQRRERGAAAAGAPPKSPGRLGRKNVAGGSASAPHWGLPPPDPLLNGVWGGALTGSGAPS